MKPHNTLHASHVNDRRDFPASERDNTEGPESRPERTSEQSLKSDAEDFSATVEAEGEAALREAILDDLEIEDWEEENPPGLRAEEEDGGYVSPDELGERFMRGATQQERRSEGHDTAPPRRDEGHAAPDRAVPRPPPSPRRRVASR